MSTGFNQPGSGDSYWYEWYVGLSYVISMLAGDKEIESVTFQKAGLEGIDDVVVHRASQLPMLCVQVKHKKITTSSADNLTFGALVAVPNEGKGPKKPLLASLATGWKQIAEERGTNPDIVLYTNREMGSNASNAAYKGKQYKRLPLDKFWYEVSTQLQSAASFTDVTFSDPDLETQWIEFADSTMLAKNDIVPFLKSLTIEAGAPALKDKESELIERLRAEVCAGHQELASGVFSLLTSELRNWSTAAGNNVVTAAIARKCVCRLNRNPLKQPIEVPLPTPIFPSRNRACLSLCKRLESSKSKVVFLQGRPGSGKTRLISCLCEQMSPRPIRFYAFKPLDVDDFSYSPDAGIVSPEELWGTLLNQLRNLSELSEEKSQIPLFHEICSADELRGEVLRLAKLLSNRRGTKTILIIDGIDHAARAAESLTFLQHLPSPSAIPEGVLVLVSGQPANLYSAYPQWLRKKHPGVEVISLPNLDISDISVLLERMTKFTDQDNLVLANEMLNITKGNTLSVIYAVHAVASEVSRGNAIEKLRSSGLSENVEEYYESIWEKANDEIQRQHGKGTNALDLIACTMHLLDGALYPKLLCKAFPDVFSGEHVAARDFTILSPLMRICADDSARPVHNDFRLFASSKALRSGMKKYLSYASNQLADAALGMENDIVRTYYSVRLLSSSGRAEECIDLFDTSYVINAVAHGVPWNNLCEQAKTVYRMACATEKWENVFKIQLALSTLSQINNHFVYWLERRPFLHVEGLVGVDYMVPPLSKETAALYATTLDRCLWLLKEAGCPEQCVELYDVWFSGLTPLTAAEMLSSSEESGRYYYQEDDLTTLMSVWGELDAARKLDCIELPAASDMAPDVEALLSRYQDAYVRGALKWCGPGEDIFTTISGIQISQDAATSIIRDLLSGALPSPRSARCALFLKLSAHSFERPLGTIAHDLCLSEGIPISQVTKSRLLLQAREGGIYDSEFTLELFSESFIFGYEANCNGFEAVVSELERLIAWIDSSHREYLSFIRALRASACLGYSIGHGAIIQAGTKTAAVLEDWLGAPHMPGSLTIETCALSYIMFVSEKGSALCGRSLSEKDLGSFLFSRKPICTKLRILEHLQEMDSEVPWRYLQKEYGPNGSIVLASQDAIEIHSLLRPFLSICNKELALHCDDAILFSSARLTGHEDYSLSNLVELFAALSDFSLATESQAFDLLRLNNAATESGDNRMSGALMEAIASWAVDKGGPQLSRIRSCHADYRYDYSLIEFQLESLLKKAKCLDDVLAVLAGLIGHASCCSTDNFIDLRSHVEKCKERAADLGCGKDLSGSVSDIEFATKNIPKVEPYLPDTKEPHNNTCKTLSALTDNELEELAFYQEVNHGQWETVSQACSELAKRGTEKREICNKLIETRGSTLAKKGWFRHSTSLSKLTEAIAGNADNESFFKYLSFKSEELDKYGFGPAADDIFHILMIRVKAKCHESLEIMFRQECDSKQSWITCNGKCELLAIEEKESNYPAPKSIPELVTDILLDSVVAHDPHRTENAIRGITWGGFRLAEMRNRVYQAISNRVPYERILLEKVLDCWMCTYPDDAIATNCLFELLDKVDRADEACVLSLIIGAPGIICKKNMETPKPIGAGCTDIPSRIRGFLSTVQALCNDDPRDVREAIKSSCKNESKPLINSYMRHGDTFLPLDQIEDYSQKLLYAEMCHGRWQASPNHITASMLVDPADVWVFSKFPVFGKASDFGISDAINLFEANETCDAIKLVENIPFFKLNDKETCLGWKLYIPYGSQKEFEYYGTARLSTQDCKNPDNVIDREFGCYGLLSSGIGGRQSYKSQNSFPLCNALAGCITMTFCDCQVFPSLAMRQLGFCPRADNPLIWTDEAGEKIAWFEQYIFPAEKGYQPSAYYRQPRLWRWVCDKKSISNAAKKNELCIYWATESSDHVDQMKNRFDMLEAFKMKSPFEKSL